MLRIADVGVDKILFLEEAQTCHSGCHPMSTRHSLKQLLKYIFTLLSFFLKQFFQSDISVCLIFYEFIDNFNE